MRITCPHCGERGVEEFTYTQDAERTRPGEAATEAEWAEYIYLRDNLKGPRKEYWYHGAGCHAWLVVERDVSNHDILAVTLP
ncbi:MAG: sarcosine oxidase subunit delta [Rhodospirillales bacterium]|nr:sarcosine oxidase subunit delta [Rhodospirillales bacterium]